MSDRRPDPAPLPTYLARLLAMAGAPVAGEIAASPAFVARRVVPLRPRLPGRFEATGAAGPEVEAMEDGEPTAKDAGNSGATGGETRATAPSARRLDDTGRTDRPGSIRPTPAQGRRVPDDAEPAARPGPRRQPPAAAPNPDPRSPAVPAPPMAAAPAAPAARPAADGQSAEATAGTRPTGEPVEPVGQTLARPPHALPAAPDRPAATTPALDRGQERRSPLVPRRADPAATAATGRPVTLGLGRAAEPQPPRPRDLDRAQERPAETPLVTVTIGRIELRAERPSTPAPAPPAEPTRPALSLADYLERRSAGGY